MVSRDSFVGSNADWSHHLPGARAKDEDAGKWPVSFFFAGTLFYQRMLSIHVTSLCHGAVGLVRSIDEWLKLVTTEQWGIDFKL